MCLKCNKNMEIKKNLPIVVFDNQCYLCIKFANCINFLARGKITMIGHYSNLGVKIRDEILDDSALDMFWFIDQKNAYGGRAAIFPLVKSMIVNKRKRLSNISINEECDQECKTIKAVFVRSSSLLTHSKKIDL